jgi:hypothetical protein
VHDLTTLVENWELPWSPCHPRLRQACEEERRLLAAAWQRLRLVARQRKVLNIMHIAIVKVPVVAAATSAAGAAVFAVARQSNGDSPESPPFTMQTLLL